MYFEDLLNFLTGYQNTWHDLAVTDNPDTFPVPWVKLIEYILLLNPYFIEIKNLDGMVNTENVIFYFNPLINFYFRI
jgi:hypothetical protein